MYHAHIVKLNLKKKTCSSNFRLNVTKIKSLKGMDANITRQRKFFIVSFKINEKTILHTCVVRQDIYIDQCTVANNRPILRLL